MPSHPFSNLTTLRLMGVASINDAATSPNTSDTQTASLDQKTTLLLIDLIPALLVALYVLGIICWFRHNIAFYCCYPLTPRRWRTEWDWTGDKRKIHKGGYVNVAKDEGGVNDEPLSSSHRARSQRDEDYMVESREMNLSPTFQRKRMKKRPKSLVLKTDYTPLPTFAEEDEEEAEGDDHMNPNRHALPHTGLLFPPQEETWERQGEHQHSDYNQLGLSRYFDPSTGRLHRHVLHEPETELSQMKMKEENGMFEYTGGLGDNVIGRWFDQVVHWTTARAHTWLEPENMRVARGTEDG